MKKVLFILLLITNYATAQTKTAGDELIRAGNNYKTGSIMILTSGALMAVTASMLEDKQPTTILFGTTALIGVFIQISAGAHLKRAGLLMNKDIALNISGDGIGLVYKFNQHKK